MLEPNPTLTRLPARWETGFRPDIVDVHKLNEGAVGGPPLVCIHKNPGA
jgi:hypothetical protein